MATKKYLVLRKSEDLRRGLVVNGTTAGGSETHEYACVV
jgi:hypothetical protein